MINIALGRAENEIILRGIGDNENNDTLDSPQNVEKKKATVTTK